MLGKAIKTGSIPNDTQSTRKSIFLGRLTIKFWGFLKIRSVTFKNKNLWLFTDKIHWQPAKLWQPLEGFPKHDLSTNLICLITWLPRHRSTNIISIWHNISWRSEWRPFCVFWEMLRVRGHSERFPGKLCALCRVDLLLPINYRPAPSSTRRNLVSLRKRWKYSH